MVVDDQCGGKYQSEAIKLYLIGHGLPSDDITMTVIPWRNGRETCCASVFHRSYKEKVLIVVYGEHRNTDSIFVDYWVEDRFPPLEMVTFLNPNYDQAYENRKDIGYGRIDHVINYIHGLIDNWLEELENDEHEVLYGE